MFYPCVFRLSVIKLRNEPNSLPHHLLSASLTLLFHLSSVLSHLHSFLFSHLIPPSCFQGPRPGSAGPRFPFDWPNSLFTSPRHKRHQADWSVGRSRGMADQWGLGQRRGGTEVGGRVDGWREGGRGGEGWREGWTGRLTDAQSVEQSMGTFAELR